MTAKNPPHDLARAVAGLDECERLVNRLHKMCCEPDRSPRMVTILDGLSTARSLVQDNESASTGEIIDRLESIGAQVGHLQVACCTEARMPLYAGVLSELTAIQISISKVSGQGH